MNIRHVVIIILSLLSWHEGLSQSDSIEYNHGVPVGEDDTVQNFPDRDLGISSDEIQVPAERLPSGLKHALATKAMYKGWERFPVMLNKASGIYEVKVIQRSDTLVFGLNKYGALVTVGQRTIDDQ